MGDEPNGPVTSRERERERATTRAKTKAETEAEADGRRDDECACFADSGTDLSR